MEVARKRGWKRCKKLLDDLKDKRGYSHLKEEALDRTMWRHRFGGGFGPVVRQHTEWMNMNIYLYTYIYIYIFHSTCGATAPSGPCPPSQDASIFLCPLLVFSILVLLGPVKWPSGRRPPTLFLVIPLLLAYMYIYIYTYICQKNSFCDVRDERWLQADCRYV